MFIFVKIRINFPPNKTKRKRVQGYETLTESATLIPFNRRLESYGCLLHPSFYTLYTKTENYQKTYFPYHMVYFDSIQ